MIKELILNQSVDVNLALLVVAGLPYSGKSTVMRKVVNATGMYSTCTCIFTSPVYEVHSNVHVSDCGSAHCNGCVVNGISARTVC